MPRKRSTGPEEEFDTTSPASEDVIAFLQEEGENTDLPAGAQDLLSGEEEEKTLMQDAKEKLEDLSSGESRVTFTTDPTFEEVPHEEREKEIFISVRDTEIPVTSEDKILYLKACLNDKPVILDVKMKNGISFSCRSLSNYELDLTYVAVQLFAETYKNVNVGLYESIAQQFRASMQVVSIDGTRQPYLRFSYREGAENMDEDARTLMEKSNKQLQNSQGIRFGLMVRALNVFQHKLTRLQEAAFNEDFWKLGDID